MDRYEIINELKGIIEDYLKGHGLEMVELIHRYEGSDLILRILIDKPEGGVTLDECSYINSQIGVVLDNKEIINTKYILEVASPGLDRPLLTKSDFSRCKGRDARFFLKEPVNEKIELEGTIVKVEGDSVYAQIQCALIEIPLAKIRKAKRIID